MAIILAYTVRRQSIIFCSRALVKRRKGNKAMPWPLPVASNHYKTGQLREKSMSDAGWHCWRC